MENNAPAATAATTVVRDEITREIVAVLPFRAHYGQIVGGLRKVIHVSHRTSLTSSAVARIV